jgi:DNA-binding IclR family transcriptional regulator
MQLQFSAQTEPVALARIIAELGLKRWTATSILYRLQRMGSIEHAGHDAWQIRSAG